MVIGARQSSVQAHADISDTGKLFEGCTTAVMQLLRAKYGKTVRKSLPVTRHEARSILEDLSMAGIAGLQGAMWVFMKASQGPRDPSLLYVRWRHVGFVKVLCCKADGGIAVRTKHCHMCTMMYQFLLFKSDVPAVLLPVHQIPQTARALCS